MSITNLNQTHLTAAEVTAALNALTVLETAFEKVHVNLTPQDRQRYGSINEQNKLLVNKVFDFNKSQPDKSSGEVDWDEFTRDFESRVLYEGLISKLESLVIRLTNAKILHDYDNYQAALTDYAYTSYKTGAKAPGYETKYLELRQFFTPAKNGLPPEEPPLS